MRLLVGKRVCFLATRGVGTWAEQIALPAAAVASIPDNLSFEQAAALPLAGLSAWAGIVTTAKVAAGMRVLIHAAAGGVGSLAVQIALASRRPCDRDLLGAQCRLRACARRAAGHRLR